MANVFANSQQVVVEGGQSYTSQINANLMRVKAYQKVQIMKRIEQPVKIVPKEVTNFGKFTRAFDISEVERYITNFSWRWNYSCTQP